MQKFPYRKGSVQDEKHKIDKITEFDLDEFITKKQYLVY